MVMRRTRSVAAVLATVTATALAMCAPVTAAPVPSSPASASPAPSITDGGPGRFQPLDVAGRKVVTTPRALAADTPVTAIVELAAPSAVRRMEAAGTRNERTVRKRERDTVRAAQAGPVAKIRRLGAVVEGSTATVLNTVTVRTTVRQLAEIERLPDVARVQVAQTVRRTNAAADVYTGVVDAWTATGATGQGVVVAVIDDGIDYTHADFGGSGDPNDYWNNDPTTIETGTFPTAKVIGGYDFVGDAYDAEATGDDPSITDTPEPDPDPLACATHGTHVAGTLAGSGVNADGTTYTGSYDDDLQLGAMAVAPGAAPNASLLAYKVFGCAGSTLSSIIVAAIDQAVDDGADIINLSVGTPFGTATGVEAAAIDAATAAGVLVIATTGNEGAGAYLTSSPGSANAAISVAAVDATSPTLPAATITTASTGALSALVANGADMSTPITGEIVFVGYGCDPDDYDDTAGKIALSVRGGCDRVDRAIYADAAGALASIMINDSDTLPPLEGQIPGVTIPFLGVPYSVLDGLIAADGETATIVAATAIPNPAYTGISSVSSGGLRNGDSALKPDIAAPGVSITSALAGSGTQSVTVSGTSMAAAHVAGIAALVVEQHPTLDPMAVKGIIMGTASGNAIAAYTPRLGGAGLVQARRAVDALAYPWTDDGLANLSYGFDEITGLFYSTSRSFHITNTSAAAVTYTLSADMIDDLGVATMLLTPRTLTVPAGGTATATATLRVMDPAALPDTSASEGGELAAIEGRVLATPSTAAPGVGVLTVPFAAVPNAVSRVEPIGVIKLGSTIALAFMNSGATDGSADLYQWAIEDPAGDQPDPSVPDIRNVGVQSFVDDDDAVLVFAVNLDAAPSTHALNEIDVMIDIDRDDNPDYLLTALDEGLLTTGTPSGRVHAFLLDLADFSIVTEFEASAPANSATVFLATYASAMGLTDPDAIFDFNVFAYNVLDGVDADITDTATFQPFAAAVSNGDFVPLARNTLDFVPVFASKSRVIAQGALGWLVVSPDDAGGSGEAKGIHITLN